MRLSRLWTPLLAILVTTAALPAAAAQAIGPTAGQSTCTTSTSRDPERVSTATVTICRDQVGTVLSVAGTVTDLKPGDHRCARVDISQFWGDPEEGEYVYTTDVACGATVLFNHVGGWVNYDLQVNVFWVAGGSQG